MLNNWEETYGKMSMKCQEFVSRETEIDTEREKEEERTRWTQRERDFVGRGTVKMLFERWDRVDRYIISSIFCPYFTNAMNVQNKIY